MHTYTRAHKIQTGCRNIPLPGERLCVLSLSRVSPAVSLQYRRSTVHLLCLAPVQQTITVTHCFSSLQGGHFERLHITIAIQPLARSVKAGPLSVQMNPCGLQTSQAQSETTALQLIALSQINKWYCVLPSTLNVLTQSTSVMISLIPCELLSRHWNEKCV